MVTLPSKAAVRIRSKAAVLVERQVKRLERCFVTARMLLGEWSLLELNWEQVRNPQCSAR